MLKSERIIIRLSPEEIKNLKKISELENKPVSVVLRDMIKFRYDYYEKKGLSRVIENKTEEIDPKLIEEFRSLLGG